MSNEGHILKTTVIGNSVGLRVRPPQPYPENLNYSQLLQRMHEGKSRSRADVENLCIGRSTIREVLELGDNIITAIPGLSYFSSVMMDL